MEMTDVLPTPAIESPGTEIPAPETPPPTQEGEKPQEIAVPKVDANDNATQAPETQRDKPKVSDFYRDRKEIKSLKDSLAAQNRQIEEMSAYLKQLQKSPDVPANGQFNNDFFTDPKKHLEALKAEIISQWEARESQMEQTRTMQEALELLLPKSSADAEESFEERIAKNPDRADKIDKMLKSTPLGKFFDIDPKGAAELMLMKLNDSKPQSSPAVIKKSLMGGTARGNPGMGGPKQTALQDKQAELRRLESEASNNVNLRFDEKHKERREQIRSEIVKLAEKE